MKLFKNCAFDPSMVLFVDSQTLILHGADALEGPPGFFDDAIREVGGKECTPAPRLTIKPTASKEVA